MSTPRDNDTLLPAHMDDDDRRDLFTAMLTVLEYALMDGRVMNEVSDKQLYEYMEMMKRIA